MSSISARRPLFSTSSSTMRRLSRLASSSTSFRWTLISASRVWGESATCWARHANQQSAYITTSAQMLKDVPQPGKVGNMVPRMKSPLLDFLFHGHTCQTIAANSLETQRLTKAQKNLAVFPISSFSYSPPPRSARRWRPRRATCTWPAPPSWPRCLSPAWSASCTSEPTPLWQSGADTSGLNCLPASTGAERGECI